MLYAKVRSLTLVAEQTFEVQSRAKAEEHQHRVVAVAIVSCALSVTALVQPPACYYWNPGTKLTICLTFDSVMLVP